MARRSTDLLEVFRAPREGESSPAGQGGSQAQDRRRAARPGGSLFEGLVLGPRQVLLASCVMVLLLVLAFTVGLGVGRRGGPGGGGDAPLAPAAAPTRPPSGTSRAGSRGATCCAARRSIPTSSRRT